MKRAWQRELDNERLAKAVDGACPSCGAAHLLVKRFGDGDLRECRECGHSCHESELVR